MVYACGVAMRPSRIILAWVLLALAGLPACRRAEPRRLAGSAARAPEPAVVVSAPSVASVASSGATDTPAPAVSALPPPTPPRNPSFKSKAARLAARPPSPGDGAGAGFAGPVSPARDGAWLGSLVGSELLAATPNKGGTSVAFRVKLAGGGQALFKPHQRLSSSNFRAEIAAYHLDRLLGFGRVAAVAGRKLSMAWLRQQLDGQSEALERLDREVIPEGEQVWGAMIAWHDRMPIAADPPPGWLDRMSPERPPEARHRELALAWSDMIVFDALIDNTDRWSGGNVMTLGAGGPLIFLDNASAFLGFRAKHGFFMEKPLSQVCLFRRSTVEALRAAGPSAPRPRQLSAMLAASLALDPAPEVLDAAALAALDARVSRVLRHIDACITRHGDEAALL